MKRLLVFGDGNSVHTQKWLEGLSLTGEWELYLISMNPEHIRPGIYDMDGVAGCFRIAPSRVFEAGYNYQYLFNWAKLRRQFRLINPHVITTIYLTSYGFIGSRLADQALLSHFVVGNDVMIFPDQGLWQKMLTRSTLSRAPLIVSASQTMTEKCRQELSFKGEVITQQYGLSDWVLNYPFAAKTYDLISNRAWICNSNVDYFLELLHVKPEARLLLIGQSVAGSEKMASRIESLAAQRSHCVVNPPMPHENLIAAVASSRYLVSLTSSDGASLSVMEAMAVGTVPILSDIAPNREWITHGENGFLLPLGQAERAAKMLGEILTQEESGRLKMADMNREIIQRRGSLRINMQRVSERLSQLLSLQNPVNETQAKTVNQHA